MAVLAEESVAVNIDRTVDSSLSDMTAQPAAIQPDSTARAPEHTTAQPTAASLYVGDLHPNICEKELYEVFSTVGEVASVRVCRDAITRRSLCYAYVNFTNYADGEKAIQTLNNHDFGGKCWRIMWSQRDPAQRKSGAGNLFIKNLDPSINSRALQKIFDIFGHVLSVRTAITPGGESAYGFVQFQDPRNADVAIETFNGVYFNDRLVEVCRYIPKNEREQKIDSQRQNFTNLYVKNLSEDIDDEKLREIFISHGEILSAVVMRKDGQHMGFGFVNFAQHESAVKAIEALNGTELNEKTLTVCRAQTRNERNESLRKEFESRRLERFQKCQGSNLYIRNLDDEFTDETLHTEFSLFGNIKSCKVMLDEKKNSRGFGFVCFNTPEEATKAMNELNGRIIFKKPLYVSYAQPMEQRRSLLQSTYERNSAMGAPNVRNMNSHLMQNPNAMYSGAAPMYFSSAPSSRSGFFPNAQQVQMRPRWSGQGGAQQMYTVNGGYQGGAMPQGQRQQRPRQPQNYAAAQMPQSSGPAGQGGASQGMRGQMRVGRPSNDANGAQSGFRYTAGARNTLQPSDHQAEHDGAAGHGVSSAPAEPKVVPQTSEPSASQPIIAGLGISAAEFEKQSPAEQKRSMGEALFKRIYTSHPEMAPKLTGILLELSKNEIFSILENADELLAKITEVLELLKQRTTTAAQ